MAMVPVGQGRCFEQIVRPGGIDPDVRIAGRQSDANRKVLDPTCNQTDSRFLASRRRTGLSSGKRTDESQPGVYPP